MNCRIDFLGYPVSNLTLQQVMEQISDSVRHGRKCQIVPLNANKLWLSTKHSRLREILHEAELLVPEYAVVWGSRMLGTPLSEHLGGIMLMRRLLEEATVRKYRVYFLGAREDVIRRMVTRLAAVNQELSVAGWHNGYFESEQKVVDKVNQSRPDILLVAMGTPRQEYFIRDNFENLRVPVMMGVGGSFDVLSGHRRECPSFLRHGFEWLYRMSQDPWRLGKRYVRTNSWYLCQVFKSRIGLKPGGTT